MELSSPAKINLWLRVLGRRSDGFHEVETRLCKIGIADTVQIDLLGSGNDVELTCNVPGIPLDESNLVMKALRAFEQKTRQTRSWRIHLEKRIPSGAGLGGGSSNAAVVLRAVNELCGNPLKLVDLLKIAGGIGADVPCFLLDTPAADGSGRGEQVTGVEFPWKLPLVLIKPAFPIPTPWAYQHWKDSKELRGVLYGPQICPWGEMVNGLERPVFEKYRLLPALKTWLLSQKGVTAALMSGSGSTMFAITKSGAEAGALAEEARRWCGETAWVQATETLSSIENPA
ncbi:4-diphosphocytidyl-2-C-methyl-D-erythritol kinase [Prosthecobacter fusiformis]|uniref:4-diphosphocytidyl-2-C-methyl-D-erythritol kinase n=1 Tax=Prosthecobacter fusiformis TaxID=48464 RepID=A0A4R7S4N1_9BACT|nr:4-(cytidine 5'-diphospho)-2-C-methyl-D-erythritol kinase [Prosthecobacter fusiformis]TDU73311.1 4-diphosphocytidyl-2-C-methyl-D-erythritol kinase [Prosthecobacter fusiformis]